MTDTLTITQTEGRAIVLHLQAKLDAYTQGSLLETARQLHEAGKKFLLIDLQGVEMITSAGLGALHQIYKLFTPQGEMDAWEKEKHGEPYKSPYFKLSGAIPNVYYLLNISGYSQNLFIYPTLQEALDSF